MRLFNIINELDSDAALKSDVRDMIFLAKGEKLLSLDFNKLITNLTESKLGREYKNERRRLKIWV